MSFVATHQDCPKCGHKGCASIREDGSVYCHSVCGGNVFPDGWKPRELPNPVKGGYTDYRGISASTLQEYGVICGFDAEDNLVRLKYPYKQEQNSDGTWEIKYKYKVPYPYSLGRNKVTSEGKGTKLGYLFGRDFNAGSSSRIYLTSGEEDCMTVYEILGKKFPVKSLPSDSISNQLLQNELDYLSAFKEIIWAGDSDESGKKTAEKLYAAFPDKFYTIPLTKYKDANAFVWDKDKNEPRSQEDIDALKWACLKPRRYVPNGIYVSVDDFKKIIDDEDPYQYVPTPCQALNKSIKGFTKGGMTLIKALPGTGKTAMLRYFQYHLLKNTDQKIAVLHMEETKSTTIRGVATYELGIDVNTKESARANGITEDQVKESIESVVNKENMILFEVSPSRYEDVMDHVLEMMRICIVVYGADFIFLDHAQRLAYLSGVDSATNALTEFSVKVEELCKKHDVGFIAISHVNNDGDVKYAKSLAEGAIQVLEIDRDKEAESEIKKNTTTITVTKNRPFSRLGPSGELYYDPETTIITELG